MADDKKEKVGRIEIEILEDENIQCALEGDAETLVEMIYVAMRQDKLVGQLFHLAAQAYAKDVGK